ncbi:MAG: hypothetical protein ACLTX3_07870 [Lachnospiraceae bacterium]
MDDIHHNNIGLFKYGLFCIGVSCLWFLVIFSDFRFFGETNIESDHQENIQIDPPQTVRIPSSCTISVVRDFLRKYEAKTDLEEAGILLERFWIVEEKKNSITAYISDTRTSNVDQCITNIL